MIGIEEVTSQIRDVYDMMRQKSTSSLKRRLEYLNLIKMYLESSPSEEFVMKQHSDVSLRISKLLDYGPKIENYRSVDGHKSAMDKYEKENNMKHLYKQKESLEYILNIQK